MQFKVTKKGEKKGKKRKKEEKYLTTGERCAASNTLETIRVICPIQLQQSLIIIKQKKEKN